jgi:hypothetical protein
VRAQASCNDDHGSFFASFSLRGTARRNSALRANACRRHGREELPARCELLHRAQLVDVQIVVEGARDRERRMRVEVVARPVAEVPAVQVPGEHLDRLVEGALRVGVAKRRGDVVNAPQREDRPVEHERRRLRRVLLGERAAVEPRAHAAAGGIDAEREQRAPRRLCEALLTGRSEDPSQQACGLALSHRREPRRAQCERVRERTIVDEAASLRSVVLLLRGQLLGARRRRREPRIAVAGDVALEARQPPLDRDHVQVGALAVPLRRVRLDAHVDVVPARAAGVEPPSDRQVERRSARKEPCICAFGAPSRHLDGHRRAA